MPLDQKPRRETLRDAARRVRTIFDEIRRELNIPRKIWRKEPK